MRARSGAPDRRDLTRPIQRTIASLAQGQDLPQVTRPGAALEGRPHDDPAHPSHEHRGEVPGPGTEPDGGTR